MPFQNQLTDSYFTLLGQLGKGIVHSQYPNDFELYTVALELLDSDSRVVDFLLFPINPSELRESENPNVNIESSAGGLISTQNSNYNSRTITLSGNFGRCFKFLLGRDNLIDASIIQFNTKFNEFSRQIKTGYGSTKVLESILLKSQQRDSKGQVQSLNFYNMAFGTSYLVKCMDFSFSTNDSSSNMMFGYQVTLKTLAPLSGLYSKSTIEKKNDNIITKNILQSSFKRVFSNVKTILTDSI